ncbi:hypothetical protein DFH07DRAFT_974845 [Mycena maculata]|uniref:Uncharacterized protein n=1 Tax=Mycena maculata TaxID=230809 RepID=A0AAD7ME64_9AGAR|nr:hypothetical protein DFH07DRAFT_974845 [Mycena maculata]
MPPGRKALDPALKAERQRLSLRRYAEKNKDVLREAARIRMQRSVMFLMPFLLYLTELSLSDYAPPLPTYRLQTPRCDGIPSKLLHGIVRGTAKGYGKPILCAVPRNLETRSLRRGTSASRDLTRAPPSPLPLHAVPPFSRPAVPLATVPSSYPADQLTTDTNPPRRNRWKGLAPGHQTHPRLLERAQQHLTARQPRRNAGHRYHQART